MSSATPGQQQQHLGSDGSDSHLSAGEGGAPSSRSDAQDRLASSGGAQPSGGPRRRAELPETIRTFLDRPDEVARDDVRTIINNFEKTQLVELLAHASTISREVRDALRAVVGSNATFRRLLVRNISFQSSSDTVKNALGKFGMIEEGTVVYDRHTGRSKGFAFVTFERVESACEAVSCSNQGKIYLDGRQLILKFAADKIDHDQQMGVVQALPSAGERERSVDVSAASSGGGGGGTAGAAAAGGGGLSASEGGGGNKGTYSNQSMRKLFVYNLAPYTTSETLREVFGKYGPMDECIVVYDSAGKSKRYAFVTYSNVEDAWACLEEPHKTVDGRMTFTHLASEGSSGEYGSRRSRSNFAGTSRPPRGHSPPGRSSGMPRSGSMGGGDRTPVGKGFRKGYPGGPPPQVASHAGSMRAPQQQQQHEASMMDLPIQRGERSPMSPQRHHHLHQMDKQQQQQQQEGGGPRGGGGCPAPVSTNSINQWSLSSGVDTPSTNFSPTPPNQDGSAGGMMMSSPWGFTRPEYTTRGQQPEAIGSGMSMISVTSPHGRYQEGSRSVMSPFPPVMSPGPVGTLPSAAPPQQQQQGRYFSDAPNAWGPRPNF
ncbi:hypothetical protein FOL47_009149 [Perkinsus chesapeaki]|uniref:RRM domain-containing protein n=1 Tax=Perkinsus chesapeaki TaxID=330153 RepID=A0A7J6MSS2_PERCH|nr:hypothetical protein FOL47_009149 [Perkinsus chesapeaki]